MVLTYKVANFKIKYDGAANDYFRRNMSEYRYDFLDGESEDIFVKSEIGEIVKAPEGEKIASWMGKNWLKTKEGYVLYEYIPQIDYYLTVIKISEDFSKIHAVFSDVEKDEFAEATYHDFNLIKLMFELYLVAQGGFNLHSSAISYKNQTILFSAPPGTGKSTHTALWKAMFPADTIILNDDFPAIKFINEVPVVFGTPWSGKDFINSNTSAPAAAIVFLRQSDTVSIKKLETPEALRFIITEICKYPIKGLMNNLFSCIDKLFRSVPIYLLKCDISEDAVLTVKNEIFGR